MFDRLTMKRLEWRSRRSILELDLYFSKFIEHNGFDELYEDELVVYEDMLEMEDGKLLRLFQGQDYDCYDESLVNLVNKIINI